jgi:hypothetical protein
MGLDYYSKMNGALRIFELRMNGYSHPKVTPSERETNDLCGLERKLESAWSAREIQRGPLSGVRRVSMKPPGLSAT